MDSDLKSYQATDTRSSEDFVQEFEKKILASDLDETELIFKKLKFLGLNYDPFQPVLNTECSQILESFGLLNQMSNPYQATNILLRLLDKTEEKLNNLKQ
jgi:hypothetical protein